ncbi:ARL14 effector protein-like [Eurytemora carolleeae]|uniref:ARL14 effector protein-like n=1 Tax=Eurytemora carolleeae TaxID=1294199 RepID=UPI000C793642|nr:ARL14 effector protein-like [Eurytemora carolleeae]|eukprot:XP_023333846.1 ARL14 effector protein-like [Eurytemora affinis]
MAQNKRKGRPAGKEGSDKTYSNESLVKNPTDKELRKLRAKEDSSSNFMADFDPTRPRREKQRASKRSSVAASKPARSNILFSDKGVHIKSGQDMCDCLILECPGCHFPCPKCKSTKCGHDCRNNRKWQYETVVPENEPTRTRTNAFSIQPGK